jgi:short-subunit dehydrogenase
LVLRALANLEEGEAVPIRKTILITGASSGLGEGMARAFAARGRDLALCARRAARLEALRAELLAQHPGIRISARALDVNDHPKVFEVFHAFAQELGSLDRVVINAGLGKGQPLGTGAFFKANLPTAQTNFIAALAQAEAAMEVFRTQRSGHLVMISSIAAMRGMPGNVTTYAATKAGVAALAEGIHAECLKRRLPIQVTTLHPGYIETALSTSAKRTPFMLDLASGCRAMVEAIEREPAEASVPGWPWRWIGWGLRNLPLRWVAKLS